MGFLGRLKDSIKSFFGRSSTKDSEPSSATPIAESSTRQPALAEQAEEPTKTEEDTAEAEAPVSPPAEKEPETGNAPEPEPGTGPTVSRQERQIYVQPSFSAGDIIDQDELISVDTPSAAPPPATQAGGGLRARAAQTASEPQGDVEPVNSQGGGQMQPPPQKKREYSSIDSIPQGSPPASAEKEKKQKPKGKLKITYRAHEIIARNSPYNHYFRSLLNAERFLAEKEYAMAIDVYQRLINKIPNKSIREKLLQNIRDIEDFLENYEEDEPPAPQQVLLDISNLPQKFLDEKSEQVENDPPKPATFGSPLGKWQGPEKDTLKSVEADELKQTIEKGFFDIKKAMFEGKDMTIKSEGTVELGGEFAEGLADSIKDGIKDGIKEGLEEGGASLLDQARQMREEEKEADDSRNKDKTGEYLDKLAEIANINKIAELAQFKEGLGGQSGRPIEPGAEPAGPPELPGQGSEGTTGPARPEEPEEIKEEPAINEGPPALGSEEDASNEAPPSLGSEEDAPNEAPPSLDAEDKAPPSLEDASSVTGKTADDEEELVAPEPITDDEGEEDKPPVQEIRGVLELKTPEQEDTPFLTLTYDFSKIPHQFALSRNHTILEYAYYKYKSMLVKAQRFIKRKQITKALNYYRVIREQEIPTELREMIDKNIEDIKEYLQKYLMTRQESA